MDKVNLEQKLALFSEHWTPKIVAELNGQYVKLAKVLGEMVWHRHDEEDELFLVLAGRLTLEMRDRTVTLEPGELFVVPRGVEHLPLAEEETHILLFEPMGTRQTGAVGTATTVAEEDQEWI